MGSQHGVFYKRCTLGKKGGENNQQNRNQQNSLQQTECSPADPVEPAQEGNVEHVLDNHTQHADYQENDTENKQKAEDVDGCRIGYPAGQRPCRDRVVSVGGIKGKFSIEDYAGEIPEDIDSRTYKLEGGRLVKNG